MTQSSLLNPSTQDKLDLYLAKPAQALILVGKSGSHKTATARQLSSTLLDVAVSKLDSNPNFIHIAKKSGQQNITIDDIRALKTSIKLKSHLPGAIKRVIFIEDANFLNQEAQNTLLKVLEEPASGSYYILTASTTSALLPTIVSRCAVIKVRPISLELALSFYKDSEPADIKSSWYISEGEAELLKELLLDPAHSLRENINKAKDFLRMTKYNRFLELDKFGAGKDETIDFIDALSKVARALYISSVNSGDAVLSKRTLASAKLLLDTKNALASNANSRLCMLNLVYSLTI